MQDKSLKNSFKHFTKVFLGALFYSTLVFIIGLATLLIPFIFIDLIYMVLPTDTGILIGLSLGIIFGLSFLLTCAYVIKEKIKE
jgi:hypothetical protein